MGRCITPELVSYQLPGWLPLTLQCLAKETRSRFLVSPMCYQNINDIPILIDGRPQIATLTLDGDEEFIHVPDVAQCASAGIARAAATLNWSKGNQTGDGNG